MTDAVEESSLIDWELVLKSARMNKTLQGKAIQNQPSDILDSWIMVEALSPEGYQKPEDLALGESKVFPLRSSLPWHNPPKPPKGKQYFYIVYLGAVRMNNATEKLLRIYQDNRIERPRGKQGFAALGAIVLNAEGIPLDKRLSVASFGWAYGRALQQRLDDLKSWEVAEPHLFEGLEAILCRSSNEHSCIAQESIEKAYQWLVQNCHIPEQDVVAPSFIIRQERSLKKGAPDAPLLNSFFLSDLQKVKKATASHHLGRAMQAYLGMVKPQQRYDLFQAPQCHNLLESILQPKNIPQGRWPGEGRHALALLQQVAVNLAFQELDSEGLFSVNGPPGTGKTTLLRDVIAANLVGRAKAMSRFDDPETAFTLKETLQIKQYKIKLSALDSSLCGYEMLVASCNNNAVENITCELPQAEALAEDLEDCRYFTTLSDALMGQDNSTWGNIAAALGKSENRSKFINSVWWSEETGLKDYFRVILGQLTFKEDENIPKIVEQDNPPTSLREAKSRWQTARREFKQALKAVHDMQVLVQEAYESQQQQLLIEEKLVQAAKAEQMAESALTDAKAILEQAKQQLNEQQESLTLVRERAAMASQLRPGWFARFFRTRSWREWYKQHHTLLTELQSGQQGVSEALKQQKIAQTQEDKAGESLKQAQADATKWHQALTQEKEKQRQAAPYCEGRLLNSAFWQKAHHDKQLASPHLLPKAHLLRDALFVAAIKLHKAFIDAAVKPLRQNLGLFFDVLAGNKLPHDKQVLLPQLWSSIFLVTPVVSTTFASVGRMLEDLPAESMGWLLIDEAGQAPPQQAAGAIWRAKRVIAVGDPLQVEPIESLPPALVKGMAQHVGVESDTWLAPIASVQTLADEANPYGAALPREIGEMQIGCPLLVHRRCEDPMFSLCNELAYANLMVHAKQAKPSVIGGILGHSQWFNVEGTDEDKWCPEEGIVVRDMIFQLMDEVNHLPDIYVISPFRTVADNMKRLLKRETAQWQRYGFQYEEMEDWLKESIGTVHTFQGKEAEAVIFLLGATDPEKSGARQWATASVNILNVAVSRAKQRFYIVGNKRLWSGMGNMKLISKYIV
jgi:hypothetical protein